MGKNWDKAVPTVEIWKECLRVLKPGGFAFIMSAPRSDVLSRMIVRIEDAGFRVDFTPLYWTYASGFPKAMNIGKMVDKRGANSPDELRRFKSWLLVQIKSSTKTQKQINDECGFTATSYCKTDGKDYWTSAFPSEEKWVVMKNVMGLSDEWDGLIKRYDKERGHIEATGGLHGGTGNTVGKFTGKQLAPEPYSEAAKALEGSYGGFQPKPAVEVIIVAMKPLSEKTFVDQALKNGKGITWLDDCRVPLAAVEPNATWRASASQQTTGANFKGGSFGEQDSRGRFPANCLVSDNILGEYSRYFSLDSWRGSGFYGKICVCEQNPTKSNAKSAEKLKKVDVVGSEQSSVQESADMRGSEKTNGIAQDAISNEDTQCSEGISKGNMSISLNTSGSGKKKMEKNQKDMSSTISTGTSKTTDLRICNLCGMPTTNDFTATGLNLESLPPDVQATYPFLQTPKASKREKNEGLSGTLTVKYNGGTTHNDKEVCKDENTVAVQLLEKVMCDTAQMSFSTGESGGSIMALFPQGSSSIIKTTTSKIIESKILNLLTRSLTNDSTPDANSAKGSGGSPAASAASLRKWILATTNGQTELARGASRVASEMLSQISGEENWEPHSNIHSTVKPLTLMSYLITLGSRAGDVVLDPFLGSGTTALAAKQLGRQFIGIEREAEYVAIAEARLVTVQNALL